MHAVYNAEAFRRNPRLGIGLGVILLGIAAGGLATQYPEYKSLGKAPEALTAEQAVPSPDTVPDTSRWVSLPAGLKPDCKQIVHETSSGAVTGTRILASDESRQRWFYLRVRGDVDCQTAAGPLVGILKKADSGLPAWLASKGMVVPTSPYPLMELSVDERPGGLALVLSGFLALGILGVVIIVVFARMKPLPARRLAPRRR
jgi:hypothetical protein